MNGEITTLNYRLFDLAAAQRTGGDSWDGGVKILSVGRVNFFIPLVMGFDLRQGLASKDSWVPKHSYVGPRELRKGMSLVQWPSLVFADQSLLGSPGGG